MDLKTILKEIIKNPDDLSAIPDVIGGIEEMEKTIEDLQTQVSDGEEKIGQLHELNRKYLKMIPVKDEIEEQEQENNTVTIEDAVTEILEEVL